MNTRTRHGHSLSQRLSAHGIDPRADPVEVWRQLFAAEGRRATIIDLYELVAARRGLQPHDLPLAERYELASSALPIAWPGFERTPVAVARATRS